MMWELSERARLMQEIQGEDVRLALPVDLQDLFLLASPDRSVDACAGSWVPVRVDLVVANAAIIAQTIRVARPFGLLIVRTFQPQSMRLLQTFAFTPSELVLVKMIALIESGRMAHIQTAIEPFAVSEGQWRQKLQAAAVECETPARRSGSRHRDCC
jgi:hypothetical protein